MPIRPMMLEIAGIEFDRSLDQRHGLGEAIPGIGMKKAEIQIRHRRLRIDLDRSTISQRPLPRTGPSRPTYTRHRC